MKPILEVLIEEFIESLPDTLNGVPRSAKFSDLSEFIDVAIGVRRCGKSYFIHQKIREIQAEGVSLEQILYINFEDDRLHPMNQKQLGILIDEFYTLYPENHKRLCYLFLDEIQNVEDWPLVVRRYFDSKNVRIYLTGSSAKLLSKEIASSLRGRSIATEIWPYSFEEYRLAHDIPTPHAPIGKGKLDMLQKHLLDYLIRGGFPAVQSLHESDRRTILQGYVDTVVLRDIVERHNIQNPSLIKYLIKGLLKNIAAPFSINKFYNDIKSQGYPAGKDTLYRYMDYIEDAFLAFTVPIFDPSERRGQTAPKKIYAVDNGLVWASSFDINSKWSDLFENHIYLDLRRQGKKIFHYKTSEGYEVDFVVQNLDGSFELIQVAWDINDPETLEREERALRSAEKELGISGKILDLSQYLRDCCYSKSGKHI